MPTQKQKSTEFVNELVTVRHDIRAFRQIINESLDAMMDRINRLLPDDTAQSNPFKGYSKKDWERFLE